VSQAFIDLSRAEFALFHRRAAKALAQLTDEDVNWRPNDDSNSIANLVVHMAGGTKQRFLTGILGEPDTRDRDAEFNLRATMSKEQVLALWDESMGMIDRVLAGLAPERLTETQQVREHTHTHQQVILRQMAHIGEHVGQILYIAKLRMGGGFAHVSIPHRRA